MSSDTAEKKRVQFRAPEDLVEQADTLATVLGTDRTAVILSALRDHLRDAAHDDELKQELAEAYYDDEISYEELKGLVGHEEAANFRVLKEQLDETFVEATADELADS
jgi:predicted transcriptional regulator